MGTTVSSSVTDEDLDRHVAELILKEAKQKAETYGRLGIKAYLPTALVSTSQIKLSLIQCFLGLIQMRLVRTSVF
jgi:hypothetical protein